ncbi:MAG: NADH dehydrogenase (quinone) subunit D [Deltaproteobacteria bacterium]|nr:NADH dehydrogenase (quinone) subunit D [Deltaproteobacteria bacterium]
MSDLNERVQEITINMGPSHPAMHGTIRLLLTLVGEKVVKCDTQIGYLHRAFEKMCEANIWQAIFPYTDRLNYVSPLMNNVGYAQAVERLIGIDVPERTKYIRVLLCELSRIADHLTCIAAASMELGAFTVFLYCMEARDLIWDRIEELTGARVTPAYVRIGGLARDLPEGFNERVCSILPKIEKVISEVDGLLTNNPIFIDRMRGTGIISSKDAIEIGFTGPCLRATGVNHDLRKRQPYLIYDRLEFEVPVGSRGDNYDRYMVRMEEMRQSIKIIRQVIKDMPDGKINIENTMYILPPKEEVYNTIEGVVNHFKLIIDGIQVPKGEIYDATEAANGELGFYLVSDGSGRPVKCRVRSPSFALMQGLEKMVVGGYLADVIPTFGSINMIGGECDR